MLYGTVLAEKQKCTKTNYPKAASHAIGSANSQAVQKGLVSCALTVADFEARDTQFPQPEARFLRFARNTSTNGARSQTKKALRPTDPTAHSE